MSKSQKKIIKTLSIILTIVVIIAGSMYIYRSNKQKFVKPEFDEERIVGYPKSLIGDALYRKTGTDSNAYVSLYAIPAIDEGRLWIFAANMDDSIANVKFRIVNSENKVVAESGLLAPGEYVESIKIDESVKSGDELTVITMCYENETYYSLGSYKVKIMIMD